MSTTASTTTYRLALAVAAGTALFLVLGAGALGIIGAGGRADRAYLAVLVVLVVGAAVARLRPRGMATVLVATAATQVAVPVVVLLGDPDLAQTVSVVDVVGLTAMFAGLFLLSAWLFRRSGEPRPAAVGAHPPT
jgi:hypothetical protein